MLTLEEAKHIAYKELSEFEKQSNIKLHLFEDKIQEFKYGWMFFYQSEEAVMTGNIFAMLGGNAPIMIDKYDGSIQPTGTGKEPSFYIEEYCEMKDGLKR
jgi:hypothetical protein